MLLHAGIALFVITNSVRMVDQTLCVGCGGVNGADVIGAQAPDRCDELGHRTGEMKGAGVRTAGRTA
ncbi:hypothetical protein DMH26_26690 [Streptomyces sp. WAC 05379]|nr:hypothetical protein DMH26_26690 [Streptomyces sp. WAC 05379]